MMVIIFRVIAVIGIATGLLMKMNGYPEGDSIMKFGITVIVLVFVCSYVHISRHSRGTI